MNVINSKNACIMLFNLRFKTQNNSIFSELQRSLLIYMDNIRKNLILSIRAQLATLTGDFGHRSETQCLVLTEHILRAITQDENLIEIIREIGL